MLLPALVDLGRQDIVTFVGREPGLSFITDYVHDSMDIERPVWHSLFMEEPDCVALPIADVELAIAFFRDKDGCIQFNLRTLSPRTDVHVFPSFPADGRDVHVAWYLAECLQIAGLPVRPDRALNAAFRYGLMERRVAPGQREKIIIHPGSGDLKKNHPPDFFLELAGRLAGENSFGGLRPLFLLGPAEESLFTFFHESQRSIQSEILICPDKGTIMGLFRETSLYIGHDSGISHLAAMLGAPTIALFKEETAVRQWRPLGPHVEVIMGKGSDSELMKDITEASQRLLADDRSPNR